MDSDAVGMLNDVAVGKDRALGIDDDAGAEGTVADGTGIGDGLPPLATEEAVKKVVEGAAVRVCVVVIIARRAAQVAVRILDRGFGVDVDHGGLQLLGDLGKGVGKLLGGGNGERGGVARLGGFLALDTSFWC